MARKHDIRVLIESVTAEIPWRTRGRMVAGDWDASPDSPTDFAVLDLAEEPHDSLRAAPLGAYRESPHPDVEVYGHPESASEGIWVTAVLRGSGGIHPNRVQLDGDHNQGAGFERGFSGAGVWHRDSGRVIGIITESYVHETAKIGWMLPLERIAAAWPPLQEMLCDPGGPAPVDVFAVVDALARVPELRDREDLQGLVLIIETNLAGRLNVLDSGRPLQYLYYIVDACQDRPGGLESLRKALEFMSPGSVSSTRACELLDTFTQDRNKSSRDRG
jgi:hypothetical protein